MLANLRARREREEGFTLIELMVVVLIIAILIAIAIPTFLGARSRAQDKNSQSNLRNGITAAKTIFTDSQDYADATTGAAGTLAGVEPSLTFVANDTASTQPKEVSVLVADGDASVAGNDTIYTVSKSKSGKCWAARDIQAASNAGTSYSEVTGGTCDADAAAVAANVSWSDEF